MKWKTTNFYLRNIKTCYGNIILKLNQVSVLTFMLTTYFKTSHLAESLSMQN